MDSRQRRRDDVLASVVDGTEPVLALDADGDLTLDTGCNRVRRSYEVEGDRLFVDDLSQTFKQCDEPAGVMRDEPELTGSGI